jgi:predicted porin
MNKKIIAAAILAAGAGAASAQSGLTIYGIADAGYVRESGGASGIINKLTSGVGSHSRIGFRGTEDLGGGLSALFTLETGFRLDTGEVDTPNGFFNRQAYAGLKSRLGTLTLGRQYTPWHQALTQVGDPFATGFAGGSKNLFPDFGSNVRTSNTVMYSMPATEGFTADLAFSLGEQPGSTEAGRQIGASVGYTNGPLNARFAWNLKNSDIAAAAGVTPVSRSLGRNYLLAANYDFKVVKAYFAWGVDKGFNSAPLGNNSNPFGRAIPPTPSTDSNEILLGVSAPIGPGTLLASYMHKNDKTSFDQIMRLRSATSYKLSKRTGCTACGDGQQRQRRRLHGGKQHRGGQRPPRAERRRAPPF